MQSTDEKSHIQCDNIINPIIPKNIDINCFEMKKVNFGWKTIAYNWNRSGYIIPDQCNPNNVLKEHSTLTKIKNDFIGEYYIRFVIDYPIRVTAPSTIYQVIIECETLKENEDVRKILQENKDRLSFSLMLEYEYVNDIPIDVLKTLYDDRSFRTIYQIDK
jgi:hypothetical protein